MNAYGIVSHSLNIRGGANPPFDISEFKKYYPSFFKPVEKTESEETEAVDAEPFIPDIVLEMYIELAHSCVKQSRYHKAWKLCMGLFIAHLTTLYMQSMADPLGGAATVVQAGQSKGLVASKSVDGVSVSYDFTQTMQDLEGWAMWKSTTYGTQLVTLAKMYGKGGMYVQ